MSYCPRTVSGFLEGAVKIPMFQWLWQVKYILIFDHQYSIVDIILCSGTVSISTTNVTSPFGPYLCRFLPKIIKNASLLKRYLGWCLINMVCCSLMALVRVFVDTNHGAAVIFGTIAFLRAVQGFGVGVTLVLVQVRDCSMFPFL